MSWTSEFTKNGLYLALSNPLKATCFDLVDKATYTRNAVVSTIATVKISLSQGIL
jgi:hypothetical protein